MAKRKIEESAVKDDEVKKVLSKEAPNSDKKNKKQKKKQQNKDKVEVEPTTTTPTKEEQVKSPKGNTSEKKNKPKQDDKEDDAAPKSVNDKQQQQVKKSPKGGKNKSQKGDNNKAKKDDPAEEEPKETWSKSKRKRMRMLLGKQRAGDLNEGSATTSKANDKKQENKKDGVSESATTKDDDKQGKKSSLQDAFKARLTGSRFRILNEELYTTTSKESLDRFSKNPELFEQYHEGFRHQVEAWPVNPVDVIVRSLSSMYQNKGSCVVADFGCGDAQLAKDLLKVEQKGKCPFSTVHSFDLISNNEWVTACDMANVPLEAKSVDVCVFCLSLMGTNLADFIREAHRVLKDDGRVMIAEVRSRIEYSHAPGEKNHKKNNKDNAPKEKTAGTLSEFVDVMEQLGFESVRTDRKNKMFLLLELKMNKKVPNKKLAFSAKPCIYKRR
jgi:ubiquinone/menaquinone biosynthesis C-methylase UbiE